MNKNIFAEISSRNAYSLSKTLRFELKPMLINPDTGSLEVLKEEDSFLKNFNFSYLEQLKLCVGEDKEKAADYKAIKPIIDELHKRFIEGALPKVKDLNIDFEKAFRYYVLTKKKYEKAASEDERKKQEAEKKENLKKWPELQKEMRKKIASCFKGKDFDKLFNKELLELIPTVGGFEGDGVKTPSELTSSFQGFTTYFAGFHENRKNMYADDGGTAIAHRLINDNLPKFFMNIQEFKKLEKYEDLRAKIGREYEEINLEQYFQSKNFILFLSQDGIKKYNEIIEAEKGAETKNSKQGLRQLVNEYKQKTKIDSKSLPNFTRLYDQILGKHGEDASKGVFGSIFHEDKELLNSLRSFYPLMQERIDNLQSLLRGLKDRSQEQIFIKATSIETFSHVLLGNHNLLAKIIEIYYIESRVDKSRKNENKLHKDFEAYLKQKKKEGVFSIQEIQSAIEFYKEQGYELELGDFNSLGNYFSSCKTAGNNTFNDALETAWSDLQEILSLEFLDKDRSIPKTKEEAGGKGFQQVERIKKFLDAYMDILHFCKPLYLFKVEKQKKIPLGIIDSAERDSEFYGIFDENFEAFESELIPLYNQIRNYLTKKPYSLEKFKINFGKGTLLAGWDLNKEKDNLGVLFTKKKAGKLYYYLGIMADNKIFDFTNKKNQVLESKAIASGDENAYQKVVYKYLAGPNKMLPKVFFADSNIDIFTPSEEILRIRNTSSFTKNGEPQKGSEKADFNLDDCHSMIDFYKDSIKKHKDWSQFNFQFLDTQQYQDISQFYSDIDQGGYKISFLNIKESYINDCVRDGKLFLFQIYSKDFSENKKEKNRDSKPNLHTLYWHAAFKPWLERNESNVKLNGEAEIFFREHTLERKLTHPKDSLVQNKNPKNLGGKRFEYDLIKDKRFTTDKFFFHVPITINYKSKKEKLNKLFNEEVNTLLIENREVNIIGIDRGERNLLYYTIVDQNGKIIKQESLNEIISSYVNENGTKAESGFNYQDKLNEKEAERKIARENWGTIENIKELKSGYLSHVVNKLMNLVLEHNAIICMEDLNAGFKRSRMKIEKQVYQKFELALINKLNCLVFKDKEEGEIGSYTNPYQLCSKVTSYKDIYSQTGIVFYVNPAYTSKICPRTGFINFLDLSWKNEAEARKLIKSLAGIRFNLEENYFEFELDYKQIPQTQNKACGSKTRWTICTYGEERYLYDPKTKNTTAVNVTETLQELFNKHEIRFQSGSDIKQQILALGQGSVKFLQELMRNLRLTMTLRHTDGKDLDFILSPIKGEEGFFDSRDIDNACQDGTPERVKAPEPLDADANGAYHIAMKGLQILKEKLSSKDANLTITKEDWFEFIQNYHESKWKEKSLSPI